MPDDGQRQPQRHQQRADALPDAAPADQHRMLARQVARRAGAQQRTPGTVTLVSRQQRKPARQRQHAADGGLRHDGIRGALGRGDGDAARMQALIDLAVGARRMHMHPAQRRRVAHRLVVACCVGRDAELGGRARDVA
jgi:hypothetical protein